MNHSKNLFLNHLNQIHWYWRLVIFLLFLFAGSWMILKIPILNAEKPKTMGLNRDLMIFLPNLTMVFLVVLISWLQLRCVDKRPWASLGLTFHPRWRQELLSGMVMGLLGPLLIAAVLLISGLLTLELRVQVYPEAIAGAGLNFLTWLALGLFYELVFRGYFLQTVSEGLGKIAATISISALYGMILGSGQGHPLTAMVNVALAGALYSITYFRTRALWTAVGLHVMWNFTQSYLLGSRVERYLSSYSVFVAQPADAEWWTGGHFGIDGGLIGSIILLVLIWYAGHSRLFTMTETMRQIKYNALITPFRRVKDDEEKNNKD